MDKKASLGEVMIMRMIVVVMLVLYHAFIIYKGGWSEPVGFTPIPLYSWIAKFAYSFMLQAFVFISGYIYSYQIFVLNKQENFILFVTKKIKRLLVPSIFFSLIYYVIFIYNPSEFDISTFGVTVLSGAGHMWFLPMLFWCFVMMKVITVLKVNQKLILPLVFLLSLSSSIVSIPFGIKYACYYFLFFYSGFYFFKCKSKLQLNFSTLLGMVVLFCVCFFSVTILNNKVIEYREFFTEKSSILNPLLLLFYRFNILFIAVIGIFTIYHIGCFFSLRKNYTTPSWIAIINKNGYGIYIYQQFILLFLYYSTPVPEIMGPLWLPWFGFIITMLFSLMFSFVTLKNSFGRFLIG